MASKPLAVFAVALYRDGKDDFTVSGKIMVEGQLVAHVVEPPTNRLLAWGDVGNWMEFFMEFADEKAQAIIRKAMLGEGGGNA